MKTTLVKNPSVFFIKITTFCGTRSGLCSAKRRDFYKRTDGFLTSVVFIYFGLLLPFVDT